MYLTLKKNGVVAKDANFHCIIITFKNKTATLLFKIYPSNINPVVNPSAATKTDMNYHDFKSQKLCVVSLFELTLTFHIPQRISFSCIGTFFLTLPHYFTYLQKSV